MVNEEWITNQHQEELIIRLLEEVADGQIVHLVAALETYNNWQAFFESFDNPETFQGLFRAFKRLYDSTKSVEEQKEIQAVFDFNMLLAHSLTLDYTSGVTVSYPTDAIQISRQIRTASWTPHGLQNVQTNTVPHATLSVFDPVAVILNDDHTNVGLQPGTELRGIPAGLVAFLVEKRDAEFNKQLLSTALDVSLLAVGVGEISAAIAAYRTARTTRALFRLTLATADFAASYADLACQSEDTELCRQ